MKVKTLKLLFFLLCCVLIFEAFVYFVLQPGLSPVKISFMGNGQYTDAELLSLLPGDFETGWLHFDVSGAATAISSFAGIESVVVEKHFPDRVVIQVRERVPVAMTLATIGERTVSVMLDRSGVVFPGRNVQNKLPLITGLAIENHIGGLRLAKGYQPLLEKLAALNANAASEPLMAKCLASLSEIHVRQKSNGTFDLVLYPVHSGVRVLMDKFLNEDALHYMMVALDVAGSMGSGVKEIDLRHGSAAFRGAVAASKETLVYLNEDKSVLPYLD
ncbi:MAG: FtsQ-type POTRA domain-containing protein [Spirochaetaceae bacterium]|jgi:cell division protein FtsQ|nr:FtsQ-type POTRA domain-containing protein [Spirochaetaceae bacterium]